MEESTRVVTEAISNIRTVVSFGREETFHSSYMASLYKPYVSAKKLIPIQAILWNFPPRPLHPISAPDEVAPLLPLNDINDSPNSVSIIVLSRTRPRYRQILLAITDLSHLSLCIIASSSGVHCPGRL